MLPLRGGCLVWAMGRADLREFRFAVHEFDVLLARCCIFPVRIQGTSWRRLMKNKVWCAVVLSALIGLCIGWLPKSQAAAETTVKVGPADIGGVVTSSKGPEAGVWVIAETEDFPTKFVRIVVTDEQGRYLVPD